MIFEENWNLEECKYASPSNFASELDDDHHIWQYLDNNWD